MAQPVPIVADPISSDGSEESWILLDEMDEAMREEFIADQNVGEINNDQATITPSESTLMSESSSPEIEVIASNDGDGPSLADDEPSVDYPSNVETISSAEAVSACPSNDDDEDEDDTNDVERLRR